MGKTVNRLYLQRFSAVGDGMHLELCIADDAGALAVDQKPYPLASIKADERGRLMFVIYTPDGDVTISVTEIERAIHAAKSEVHPEAYYYEKP